jgi:hypothetical protein
VDYRLIRAASTDVSVLLRFVDSTTGAEETGIAYNTAGLDLKYWRPGAAVTSITEVTLAAVSSAHSDGGVIHIGAGIARVDLPDAACAAGVPYCLVFGTCTGMIVSSLLIDLTIQNAADVQSGLATSTALQTVDDNVDAILADTGTDGVVVVAGSKTGYTLSNAGIDALYTRALTESYSTDGAAMTVAQALFNIQQFLQEKSVSGTTMTIKKLDGSTTAYTLTLNSSSAPTSITRAT